MNVTVCLSFDFDAMSSWIYGYRTKSPNALSRGEFGAVGARRLIELLAEREIVGTWFVPGHSAEAFPDIMEALVANGHEVGHHGYIHEDPSHMEPDEEVEVLDRGIDILKSMTGSAPVGYRTPSGSFSPNTLSLLLERGFQYDSSMMADDFTPYYCRVGDQAPIDGPFVFGESVDIVEIPFAWHLDDHPFFEHTRSKRGINPGLADPARVYAVWKGDFDYLYERLGEGVFTLTMHPQVIGRGHRLLMLERLLDDIRGLEGVAFKTMSEYVGQWRAANPLS
ncbi:MAG: polysaccharide deacetylase [Gammaproteobacteria bacterium]|nr:polysaccharide deacetylase [Gammaproteobacteria bacterium]